MKLHASSPISLLLDAIANWGWKEKLELQSSQPARTARRLTFPVQPEIATQACHAQYWLGSHRQILLHFKTKKGVKVIISFRWSMNVVLSFTAAGVSFAMWFVSNACAGATIVSIFR